MNYYFRRAISFFLGCLVRLLSITNVFCNCSKPLAKNRKARRKVMPNLFDDDDFLMYVCKKKKGFDKNLDKIKTIAIRGSNVDYAFYAPDWNNSYNLGLTSTNLYESYYLYKKYRKDLCSLKNVILYFTVFAPGYSLIHTSERY